MPRFLSGSASLIFSTTGSQGSYGNLVPGALQNRNNHISVLDALGPGCRFKPQTEFFPVLRRIVFDMLPPKVRKPESPQITDRGLL